MVNPKGYVSVVAKKNEFYFPVHSKEFSKKKMFPLLEQVWINRLNMESQLEVILTSEPNTTGSILPPCFQFTS